MARTGPKIIVAVEDVGGAFEALFRRAPKIMRDELKGVVRLTTFAVGQRMKANAPRSDAQYAPHIQDQIANKIRGLSGRVGILDPGPTGIEADIALFNEYSPNEQPFMSPAAESEAPGFRRSAELALKRMERQLGGFAGGLR